ncbi:MAG: response regulator, partial [Pseudoxanthomonas sp.]
APPPALLQPALLPDPEPPQPLSTAPASLPARSSRVLVVEDNPVNLAVAQRMLASLGLHSDHAENGAIALDMMSRTRYPLVLMDCQMPLLDGYTATRRWRAREAEGEEHLPIVAMTANAMAGDRQRCLDAGMDDYLSKPISREGLKAVLGRWMTLPAPAAPTPADPASPAAPPQPAATLAAAPAVESPASATAAHPATTASAHGPALDMAVLDELREVTGGELRGIVGLFLEDAPKLIAELETASAIPDQDAMARAAHSLKSSSANLGAMSLSAAARRIELGARQHALERPAVAAALVIAEFARVRVALQGYLAGLEPA